MTPQTPSVFLNTSFLLLSRLQISLKKTHMKKTGVFQCNYNVLASILNNGGDG
jgi:hypothetical protein